MAENYKVVTVTLGRQPIGIARARNADEAKRLIQRMVHRELAAGELSTRPPTPDEAAAFSARAEAAGAFTMYGFLL